MAKWPTVSNFFMALIEREKKLKIPKKNYKNTKSKNIVKTPVGEMYFFYA